MAHSTGSLSWNRVLYPSLLSQLSGLRQLAISIASEYPASNSMWSPEGCYIAPCLSRGFLRFRELGLEDVRIKMVDDFCWALIASGKVWKACGMVDSLPAKDLADKMMRKKELTDSEKEEEEKFKRTPVTRKGRRRAAV